MEIFREPAIARVSFPRGNDSGGSRLRGRSDAPSSPVRRSRPPTGGRGRLSARPCRTTAGRPRVVAPDGSTVTGPETPAAGEGRQSSGAIHSSPSRWRSGACRSREKGRWRTAHPARRRSPARPGRTGSGAAPLSRDARNVPQEGAGLRVDLRRQARGKRHPPSIERSSSISSTSSGKGDQRISTTFPRRGSRRSRARGLGLRRIGSHREPGDEERSGDGEKRGQRPPDWRPPGDAEPADETPQSPVPFARDGLFNFNSSLIDGRCAAFGFRCDLRP